MHRGHRHGLTRTEVIVLLACAPVISVILIAISSQMQDRSWAQSRQLRDRTQVGQIHQALVIYGADNEGLFPRPGLVNRLPHPELGRVPTQGEEDVDLNTTANLYSLLIAANYFTPELVISSMENNPFVVVDMDYDYGLYQPASGVYWDSAFKADLSRESNASYAHQPMVGPNVESMWRDAPNQLFAVVGNRGPQDGVVTPGSHTCLHGYWMGNIAMSDMSSLSFSNTSPPELNGDNLFKQEPEREFDSFLSFTLIENEGEPTFQFD